MPGDLAVSGNVNVTEDDWCYGQIKSDPDIAGLGVSSSVEISIYLSETWIPTHIFYIDRWSSHSF